MMLLVDNRRTRFRTRCPLHDEYPAIMFMNLALMGYSHEMANFMKFSIDDDNNNNNIIQHFYSALYNL